MDARRCSGDAGAGLVEYGLLVALIMAACLAAVAFFGRGTDTSLVTSCERITQEACR